MSSLLSGFWRAAIRNLLIAIVLFVLLVEGLVLFNVAVAYDAVFMISIAASIVGVAYVLTIRNPQNYTGFYLGIVSSALLGIQFYLLGSYDLTFLYFLVFIPFQVMAIYTWLKADKADAPVMLPS